MAAMLDIGKKIGIGALGIAGVAGLTGLALSHEHNRLAKHNPQENVGLGETVKRGLLDFALGDETADIDLMGFPARLSDFIPNPFMLPVPQPVYQFDRGLEATRYAMHHGGVQNILQNAYYQDKLRNWSMSAARSSIKNYSSAIDYGLANAEDLPYNPDAGSASIQYNPMSRNISDAMGATGDMVFGMYNLRQR